MFAVGDFANTTVISSKKNTMEFEKYCKDEGLSSIQLRREVCKLYSNKRKEFFKSLFRSVKKILRYSRNRLLN